MTNAALSWRTGGVLHNSAGSTTAWTVHLHPSACHSAFPFGRSVVGYRQVTAEDATLSGAVVQLRAGGMGRVADCPKYLRRENHPKYWSCEIDPAARPDAAGHGRRNGARGIDAHAGERR